MLAKNNLLFIGKFKGFDGTTLVSNSWQTACYLNPMKMNVINKSLAMVAILVSSLTAGFATPTPLNITMSGGSTVVAAPKSDIGNYGDATVFNWLSADIAAFNSFAASTLPTTVVNPFLTKVASGFGGGAETILLGGGDYIFLHWGGQGGGSEQAFYIAGLTGTFSFTPPPGGNPAVGGLSFYSVYGAGPVNGPSVPDGGTTAAMLGGALTMIGLIRRKLSA